MVEKVALDDFIVVVRSMGKCASAIGVTQCPNSGYVSAKLVIYYDIAVLIGLDAGLVEAEVVGIRDTSDRQHQMRARDCAQCIVDIHAKHYPIAPLRNAPDY